MTAITWKKRVGLFLLILGPGLITAFAGNDAGGIAIYSIAGAHYGYQLLWVLFFLTFGFIVVQEMGVRLAVVTGKGLSDLIREKFGLRWTLIAVATLMLANMGVTVTELAGVATSFEMIGVARFLSVPLTAFVIWLFVVYRSYRDVERVLLILCTAFIAYIVSALMAQPQWTDVARATFIPSLSGQRSQFMLVVALIGTTITPWMLFFVQSSVVEKGLTLAHYKMERLDTTLGAILANSVAFFIIVAAAATLFPTGVMIHSLSEAAAALAPVAGRHAQLLFGIGLFGASVLALSVVPLSTAFVVCEAFGHEHGVSRTFTEAPVFYSLFTAILILAVGVVLWPGVHLVSLMIRAQQLNGLLLPIMLGFLYLLTNDAGLMGKHRNRPLTNAILIPTLIVVLGFAVGSVIL